MPAAEITRRKLLISFLLQIFLSLKEKYTVPTRIASWVLGEKWKPVPLWAGVGLGMEIRAAMSFQLIRKCVQHWPLSSLHLKNPKHHPTSRGSLVRGNALGPVSLGFRVRIIWVQNPAVVLQSSLGGTGTLYTCSLSAVRRGLIKWATSE